MERHRLLAAEPATPHAPTLGAAHDWLRAALDTGSDGRAGRDRDRRDRDRRDRKGLTRPQSW